MTALISIIFCFAAAIILLAGLLTNRPEVLCKCFLLVVIVMVAGLFIKQILTGATDSEKKENVSAPDKSQTGRSAPEIEILK